MKLSVSACRGRSGRNRHVFRATLAVVFRLLIALVLLLTATEAVTGDGTIYSQRQFTYPDGLTKALVLSYDDGPAQDRRLVALFNECGLRGTFHINSGRLGLEAEWMTEAIGDPGWYVGAGELAKLYAGHEVASHTVNHPHLYDLGSDEIELEIQRDIETLESLGAARVESFAYPFGDVDDRIVAAVASTAITNARTVESTGGFELPDDFLRWHPSAHQSAALPLIDDFLSLDGEQPALFMIWGHSWEFDGDSSDNNWDVVRSICERLGGRDDTWYVTAGEFVRYIDSVRSLHLVDDEWHNDSAIPVWIRTPDGLRKIAGR
jgi:peptidoglycan/xylan/chitin deacetylase (PgdA/CDA1 family)